MVMTVHVDIVSTESSIYSGVAEIIIAPGKMGQLGITPRHAPLFALLQPGEIKLILPNHTEEHYYVSGGFIEVLPNLVTILSDTCIRARDLDEERALEAKRTAESMLERQITDKELVIAEYRLLEAIAQLRIIEKRRN